VEAWLDEVRPDVVCLQETKLADDAFPALTFQAQGYESVHRGQGQWNGVAILSKVGIEDVSVDFADGAPPDEEARLVSARCGGVFVTSVYVPNGRALDHEHYQYKLAWLGRLRHHLMNACSPTADDVVVLGDFNIAPADDDVFDPSKFTAATHTSEPERAALRSLCDLGLVDVFRQFYSDARIYSWWDYRAGDFHQGRGLRIDLILASQSIARRAEWCVIDRNARKGKQPSDHAPVVLDVADLT
jgi:exodeoxyribonuclease-3